MRTGGRELLLRVCAELGSGRITEAYISGDHEYIDGLQEGSHVTVNPAHQTVDTVIHELLHRMYPQWSERYVRNRTGHLRALMSDGEVQAFYAEYQRRVRRRKRPKKV